ncbi:MAG TPA: glycosyltransferase [Thermoanaerobaculia bacterium]|nr:glycosyltransferase [Thermoanaerobaculia bacterium]
MSAPILTAIVSAYNSERFMRGCLEDLEAQTISDRIEIVVIDSNSPQREAGVVREFQERSGNIRYLRTPERETLYKAWNRGVEMARGKYLTSANTDDRHRRDAFETLVSALERHPDAALAYADAAVTLREGATADSFRPAVFLRWPEFDARLLFQVDYVGSQPVWRRDLHERYGLFDDSFVVAADYEFWLRMVRRERFVHVPEPVGVYLAASSSIEHKHPELAWRESELARERWWPAEWGRRPRPHGFFLRPDLRYILARLARCDAGPAREVLAHARMLIHGRLHR